jgi:hypothetical protein
MTAPHPVLEAAAALRDRDAAVPGGEPCLVDRRARTGGA